MDAFFASIEQRDHPEYRSKPIAVGGIKERGVVAAASYEARKFGVRSAMPTVSALKRCPNLVLVHPRFDVYKKVSMEIMEIFRSYTDLVEPLSLDEAFLDVTCNKKNISSATLIAGNIKSEIYKQTELTASAGVSINKFLAKIASDMDKPDGLFVILPEEAQEFIDQLKIEKFYGVGKATTKKMHSLGIFNGADLKKRSKADLVQHFGKNGDFFYNIARAIDNRPVNPESIRKSYGKERTFDNDISEFEEIREKIEDIAQQLWNGLQKTDFHGKTVVIKIKYADFIQNTRSKTLQDIVDSYQTILSVALELIKREFPLRDKIRLLGITITNADTESEKPEDSQLILDF